MSSMYCIYRHFGKNGGLLYIGYSSDLLSRTNGHKNNSRWFIKVTRIEIEHFKTRDDALKAEAKAIIEERPIYNNKTQRQIPGDIQYLRSHIFGAGDYQQFLVISDRRKFKIRNLARAGTKYKEIAKTFAISIPRVSQIVNGK